MLKKKLFLSLCFASLIQYSGYAQETGMQDISPDLTPYVKPTYPVTEAIWDIQFSYDATAVTGSAGNIGAIFIPTIGEFWTSRWGSNLIHRWTPTGTLIEQFSITDVTGVRSFTFDGTYIYAGVSTFFIQIIDPVSRTRVGTIVAPQNVRYITFDPTANGGAGGFWIGNFTTNLQLISMTGDVIVTHPYGNLGVTNIYGGAWDGYSPDGPFLWLWGQGGGPGTPQWIVQINPSTGLPTGVQHDVLNDVGIGNVNATAGGLFITEGLVPGVATLGGLLQGAPDRLFGYELTQIGPPCPVGATSNPNPPNGATVVLYGSLSVSWTNGVGATQIEVHFGQLGNLTPIYIGAPITSLTLPGPLNYSTTYNWRVIGKNDTCQSFGPIWSFTIDENPYTYVRRDTCRPLNADYWTGSTNGIVKTQASRVRGIDQEDGWFMFDNTNIPNLPHIMIDSIRLEGFVNSTSWPYWSATPLPGLNPVTATAEELKSAIQANSGIATAYLHQNENSTYTTGWKKYSLGNNVKNDFRASLSQGWFAIGMDSRDNSATYHINWDGWNETNKPILLVYYYILPVELTSFTASANLNSVTLEWSTATETNNMGFEIEKRVGNRPSALGNLSGGEAGWEKIGFVSGKGTTTDPQSYSFTDEVLSPGLYIYRLKQTDFDGTFEYSNEIEVQITVPVNYTLHQNYPNPFNPSTVIEYSLPQQSFVTISIYSILGEIVKTLVNESVEAGYQKVTFDASDLPSGTYIYQIRAVNEGRTFVESKKMMLVK